MTSGKKRSWLKWLGIIFVLLLLAVGGLYAYGFFLPEEYEIEVELTIDKTPEELWAAFYDVEKYPFSTQEAESVKIQSKEGDNIEWLEDMGETKLTLKTVKVEKHKYLKRDVIDSEVSLRAVNEIWIDKTENGSKIKAKTHFTIKTGTWHVPIFRLIFHYTDYPKQGLKKYFDQIGKGLNAKVEYN